MRKVIMKSSNFLIFILLIKLFFINPVPIQGRVPANASGELARIAKDYNIEIVTAGLSFPVKTLYGDINGKQASGKSLGNYITLFAPEFTVYPLSLVKRSQLKRVVLCDELYFAGQRRNAIPDFEHDTLYLDVSRGSYNKPYLRKVMHHEFFHIIDYRDDGDLYRDERWSSLNPSGFRYGSGGVNAQDLPYTSVLTDRFPGFLNHYSTTGVEEDKAEVFANLIVDHAYVGGRIRSDAVLRKKVKLLQQLLARFCPDMNSAFWEKLRQRRHARRDRRTLCAAGPGYALTARPTTPLTNTSQSATARCE